MPAISHYHKGVWNDEQCHNIPCVLHRGGPQVQRRIRILLELYRQESPAECVRQMVQSMHDEFSGLMIFVF